MEYLDYYDENKNYLGKETREKVHREGLWHNTIHCWLYDSKGNVYFQIREDSGTLYTTASGHVLAGETLKEGFAREIREELGISLNSEDCELLKTGKWTMDKVKEDGTCYKDRVLYNTYIKEIDLDINSLDMDLNELTGLVKVNAKDVLEMFKNNKGSVKGEFILPQSNKNILLEREVEFEEFLVNSHETAIGKYGDMLNKVIEKTK